MTKLWRCLQCKTVNEYEIEDLTKIEEGEYYWDHINCMKCGKSYMVSPEIDCQLNISELGKRPKVPTEDEWDDWHEESEEALKKQADGTLHDE